MKKIIVLAAVIFAHVNLFATQAGEAYNRLHGKLSAQQVMTKLQKNEILPLFVNEVAAFSTRTPSKAQLLQQAKKSISTHHNYISYYNAAVVAYTDAEWQGLDVPRQLSATDVANVINWTTKALELSRNNQAPDMYLLRALARLDSYYLTAPYPSERGINWIKNHKKEVRPIVADLEKVFEINRNVGTNYADVMAKLYRGLGDTAKADSYQKIADTESRKLSQESQKREKVAREAKKQIRAFFSAPAQSDKSKFRHPREETV